MAGVMLQNRGLRTTILESRPLGKEQKVVVGEALTEGTSVFMRHEIGLGDWLKQNAYRKFGFDFVIRPRSGELPRTPSRIATSCCSRSRRWKTIRWRSTS